MHRWQSRRGRCRAQKRLVVESLESRALLHADATLSGFVYIDQNDNSVRETPELGVPGVVVNLSGSDSSGASIDRSTFSDDNGFYSFDELEPGTYQVSKRQSSAMRDGQDSTPAGGATSSNDRFANVALADDQTLEENNFGELGLQPEFISIRWLFSSTPPVPAMLRETVAIAEELDGDVTLAETIRAGGSQVPDDLNTAPIANNDRYETDQGNALNVAATQGVLGNDTDAENDPLTAAVVNRPVNGSLSLNLDGSFNYTPDAEFDGTDTFTYAASDGFLSSTAATVTIIVNPVEPDEPDEPDEQNEPFGPVIPGSFDDAGVLGIRTDLEPGALPLNADHVTTAVDYSGYSNPPTYGPHHGFLLDQQGNAITPRATGVYETEQPDEDLVHNLEHGHVWISYNPTLISNEELRDLQQLVIDGGTDTGVILTRRAANTDAIALASWARLLTMETYDATQIRSFVEANRGKSPEGYIPAGQKADTTDSENVDDGLDHTPPVEIVNTAPVAINDSFETDEGVPLSVSSVQGILSNDADAENDSLTAAVESDPSDGSLSLNADGSFTYTPNPDFFGVDTFTYVASDAELSSNLATVTIDVRTTNNAPVASSDNYSVTESTTLSIDSSMGVLANDSDADDEPLTASLNNDVSNGQLNLSPNGSFTYTPTTGFAGTDTFTYATNDGESTSDPVTVTINVISSNRAPVAANDGYVVDEDETLNISASSGVLANDSDPDNDPLTVTLNEDADSGQLSLGNDGSFSYTPNADFNGSDTFTYSVSDGNLSSVGTVNITVNPVDDTQSFSLTVEPSQDTTLVENPNGDTGNGSGEAMFSGLTNQNANAVRRGLFAFDLAGAGIPAGATVTNVELSLNMSRTNVGDIDFSLHRVTGDWGEGASAGGGSGAPAESNDATWIHTFFASSTWNTPGGDFDANASATTSVGNTGRYAWSSAQMIADVQSWVDDSSNNFGWIIIGDEAQRSAKRFDSRETPNPADRPMLIIDYDA